MEDFSSGNILLRLRFLHPVVAAIAAVYVLWLILKSLKRPERLWNHEVMLAGVLIGQIGLGILNVLLLAPVWLQMVHLLIAELLWVLVVLASANLLFATVDCNSAGQNCAAASCSLSYRGMNSCLSCHLSTL